MDIVKSAKEIGSSVEEKIEHGLEVAKETFANVASHLPFANLAKKGSDTFSML
jgi:HSP20 family protein